MIKQIGEFKSDAVWFVGASFGGNDDQTERFLSEGIWENGYDDKLLDKVRSMQPGERIAIKSTYTRKHDLPFDNRGRSVSTMAIKAVGTIIENLNDGKRVTVNWTKVEPVREWYFFTYRETIWRLSAGDWMSEGLIAFAFESKPQDIDRFLNEPYWRERYGTFSPENRRFLWTGFYEAVANKLLDYRNNRAALVKGLREISNHIDLLDYLKDKYVDGTSGFVKDICPFTTMGIFNRGITSPNRRLLAGEIAKFLHVDEAVPETFEGIPLLNNQNSWFFPPENNRESDHIDSLWDVFAAGVAYADSDNELAREEFARAFDRANGRRGVAWNLTMGLYWIRPWSYLSLDHNSQVYVTDKLGMQIGRNGPKKRCNSADYLALMDHLEPHFQDTNYPVHSYPALSLHAWSDNGIGDPPVDPPVDPPEDPLILPYSISDILDDGCFLEPPEIERLLDRLRVKKNLILQGPPGTGKTWLAKRLAFALIGKQDDSRIRAVQFHPNLSYEDFVRGWRPTGEGKLSLVDGVFMETIKSAVNNPSSKYFVVIEEINRGNPAQIFGELLTLLEAGKRTPGDALELCYPDADGTRRPVYIPENLYVIGTMNIADRSLALVDMALRRRFAFVGLEPRLGPIWRNWVVKECAIDPTLVEDIERRIAELNDQIAKDPRLGKAFRIGHSYVTPAHRLESGDTKKWFQQIVETEIGPLLDEYWFDAPDEAQKAIGRLLQDW